MRCSPEERLARQNVRWDMAKTPLTWVDCLPCGLFALHGHKTLQLCTRAVAPSTAGLSKLIRRQSRLVRSQAQEPQGVEALCGLLLLLRLAELDARVHVVDLPPCTQLCQSQTGCRQDVKAELQSLPIRKE